MRILLAEDSALLREALVALLERLGHAVVATAASATELVALAATVDADLVLTDVRMPPTMTDDGLRAAMSIRTRAPEQPVLVLSQYVAEGYARDVLTLPGGGIGYLLKDRIGDVRDFDRALSTVRSGGTVIDPDVVRTLLATGGQEPLSGLTPREHETLALMADGLSNAEIAAALVLSDAAVSKHVGNVFLKLGLAPTDENRRVRAVLTFLQSR